MNVKCLVCDSKVDVKEAWRTYCCDCNNEIAICKTCFKMRWSPVSDKMSCKCNGYRMMSMK